MLNIDRRNSDPFYRYKMPPIIVCHESNKTVLNNLEQVSKALYREPEHILKFLGTVLGCTQIIENPKFSLNGSYEQHKIQCLIYDFIDFFVLCKICNNPETKFTYDGILKRQCASCGEIKAQEFHKLNTTLIKDIDKIAHVDKNYSSCSSNELPSLIKEEKNNSEIIYEIYKRGNHKLSDLFKDYFKPNNFRQIFPIIKEEKLVDILDNIETMLNKNDKEDRIEHFIKAVMKAGFSIQEIHQYFKTPRKGAVKRSGLIKKQVDLFIEKVQEKESGE